MSITHISADALRRALLLRDLSDPEQGPHAMQPIVAGIERALGERWLVPIARYRGHPVVSVEENYDRLGIAPDAVARETRYTRYVNDRTVLRTHTSAAIPAAVERVAREGTADVVLSCPGLTYRRDVVDRRHVGEPHQLDLWPIRTNGPALGLEDLDEMIAIVVEAALPGRAHRCTAAEHPYTLEGRQIDVEDGRSWIEIGECGLAHPAVLARGGLPAPPASGLAMGLGLDRLVMLRKGIGDIRALRSTDPRIAGQMLDLAPYRPVSSMPPVGRDLSIAVPGDVTAEELGDRAREALGEIASAIESIEVRTETRYEDLPESARARMGIALGQKNVLLRVVIRHLDRTLTDEEANRLRDRIYDALHRGAAREPSLSRDPAKRRRSGRRRPGTSA